MSVSFPGFSAVAVGEVRVEWMQAVPAVRATARWSEHAIHVHQGPAMWCRQRQDDTLTSGIFRRDHVTFTPAGTEVECERREPVSAIRLHVPAALACWDDSVRLETRAAFHRFDDPLIPQLARAVLDEARFADAASRLAVESAASLALSRVFRFAARAEKARESAGLPPRVVRRVLDFLHASLDRPVGLRELAAVAGLSPGHFARMFKRSVGVAPHRFLTELRMQRAHELLKAGSSVTAASVAVGFSNPSHFATAFRRTRGLAPSRVRRTG